MKVNVKKDREVIKDIIYKNLKLIKMSGNKEQACQTLADAIIVYLLEEKPCGK